MTTANGFAELPSGPLILASASASRRTMLERAGFSVTCHAAAIDEESVRLSCTSEGMDAGDTAVLLAEMKGMAVSQSSVAGPGQLLLAADQILEVDGEMIGKPSDRAEAAAQLAHLSGKPHRLFTAAVIFRDGQRIWHHLARTELHVRTLDAQQIEAYLDVIGDAAFWSPGSYQIEAAGVHLFSRIDGCHYTILGLPLLEIAGFLRGHGLTVAPARGR